MNVAILPWSGVKKVFKILKSSLSPNQIAFSFALGVFAGLPPMGLHVIVPMTLALLVRGSFRAFLLAMGLFKLLSIPVAPGSYAIGRFLLDSNRGLDSMWRVLFHLPVAAPMGYGRYLLLGSLVISLLIGIPVFFAVRLLVIRYRSSFTAWVSGWSMSERLRGKRWASFLRWLFVGGEAKYESAKPPRGLFRYIRREALIILPLIYLACYLVAAVVVPFFAGRIATSAASYVVGGEVAVKDSSFSLFTGRLDMNGLSVQDPNEPAENVVEVASLTLNAGMLPLLERRVVFNSVEIGDMYLHVVRQEDGTLNVDDFTSGWNADGYIEWAREHAGDVDWLSLLRRFIDHLGQPRPRKPRVDLSRYAGGRSFPGFSPSFAVERLEIGHVHLSLADERSPDETFPPLTLTDVEIDNLALPVKLARKPVLIRLKGLVGVEAGNGNRQAAFTLSANLDDRGTVPIHTYQLEVRDMDLTQLSWLYDTTLSVQIMSGRVTLNASVTITGDDVSGEVSLAVDDLIIAQRPGRDLFGLSPQLTQSAIEGINRYARDLPIVIGAAIDGSVDAPQVHWQEPLLKIARDGLLLEGRRELQGVIDELGSQIDILGPGS
ncbi:MAG TPA: TIGR03546 family protein, partial [Candidatus Acetothermia bacterium]|nr:TIGR03546 family protein [Candidatus Acetothermia bacterium]